MFSTANRMGRWRRSFKAELVEQYERRQQLGAATSSVATATSATHTSWPERMHQPPYYTNYSKSRLLVHNVVTSKYFDLAIAAVIGLNVITMAMEFYMMPKDIMEKQIEEMLAKANSIDRQNGIWYSGVADEDGTAKERQDLVRSRLKAEGNNSDLISNERIFGKSLSKMTWTWKTRSKENLRLNSWKRRRRKCASRWPWTKTTSTVRWQKFSRCPPISRFLSPTRPARILRITKQHSIDDESPVMLSVPAHISRLTSLPETSQPETMLETAEIVKESPEISPGVILVPPPYSDKESPTDNADVPTSESRQEKLQVSPVGQRVRIRLCDTRMDSGIGEEKHSQESQPSSSHPLVDRDGDDTVDQVTVHKPGRVS
ncbi:unnamed protein product [Nesidiocoris tenuis]|uniref:Uncharacterized protein n=1 Tax=Nesidiocoris tenuis TaxID=355587 RepID=A0A6H5H6B9_9HEMI|nr:unnamed protein product [Nesidiocoris tenuis]